MNALMWPPSRPLVIAAVLSTIAGIGILCLWNARPFATTEEAKAIDPIETGSIAGQDLIGLAIEKYDR